MTSISDLLDLRKNILAAEKGAAEKEATDRFRHRVEDNIIELFKEPSDQRQRRFDVIRNRFGPVFTERDDELGKILVDMGAHVTAGEGDEAVWEFSLADEKALLAGRNRSGFSKFTIYRAGIAAVIFAAVLIGADQVIKTLGGDGLVPVLQAMTGLGESHEDCVAAANDTFSEILKCHTKHGLL